MKKYKKTLENEINQIKEFALNLGIDDLAFVSPHPFKRIEGLLAFLDLKGFAETKLEKRIDPRLTLNSVKTIITAIVSYKLPFEFDYGDNGVIYSGDYFLGADYHIYFKNKLTQLSDYINQIMNSKNSNLVFSDTGPLVDRELLYRSGKYFYGKNHFIMNHQYGSLFYIGYILTDISFPFDKESPVLQDPCQNCRICLNACPTDALLDKVSFTKEKCISYLTQKTGKFTVQEMQAVGNSLYGCHICLRQCPLNKKFLSSELIYKHCDPLKIINLSSKELKSSLGDSAAGWLNKTKLTRNALAVMANSKNKGYIPSITKLLGSDNQIVKDTAEKAIMLLEDTNGLE